MSSNPAPPLLCLDVDGVISLFGFDGMPQDAPGRYHLIDGMAHCIPDDAGPRIQRLLPYYEPVWATGWEDRANDYLPNLLGLPRLPVLHFGPDARFGTAHWKLGPIGEYGAGRALAWVDDSLDEDCRLWAESREEPTLLVETESARGLQDAHVETLIQWSQGGYTLE